MLSFVLIQAIIDQVSDEDTFESDDDELADNDDTSYNSDSESDRDEDRDSFRDICTIWAAIEDYYQCDPQFSDEDVSESDNSEMDIYDDMFLNNDSNPDSNEDP